MKNNFFIILIILIYSISTSILKGHSGNTGPSGCHMNYSNGTQHCHKSKSMNPARSYWYSNQGHGPYSSVSSCQNALRGAGIIGYCSMR